MQIGGKVFFVFSDPGGAKGILSIVNSLKNSGIQFLIYSDRYYNFFQEFELNVTVVDSPNSFFLAINDFKPETIFTGTSYKSKIELQIIKFAKQHNIKTYSFIDHWINFKSRFLYDDEYVLPDQILVIDEKAKCLALSEGLANVQIIGHPYHEFLKKWISKTTRLKIAEKFELPLEKKWILYAPDPLSNLGGVTQWGIDELIGADYLNKAIEPINMSACLLVLPHPNQSMNIIKQLQLKYPDIKIIDNSIVILNELIYFSDVVVSFFSNILVESNIIGTPTIRLNFSKKFPQVISTNNQFSVSTLKQLYHVIRKL